MKKSKNKIPRSKTRRRLKLNEQRRRIASRLPQEVAGPNFKVGEFLRGHLVEVALLMLAVLGVASILWFSPNRRVVKELRVIAGDIVEEYAAGWDQAYPLGYKVVILTDQHVIQTEYDTLPKELYVDWKRFSVARIQADALRGSDEKIMIKAEGIGYPPAGVSDASVGVTFTRTKGMTVRLVGLGRFDFIAHIIEERENQVFCLLGLSER